MRQTLRWLRGPVLALTVILIALQSVSGETLAGTQVRALDIPDVATIDWKWYVTQGGLAGFALVILWSYRRDMVRLMKDAREEKESLMEALTAATAALTAHVDVSREQAQAFSHLAESVQLCEAVRKMVAEASR